MESQEVDIGVTLGLGEGRGQEPLIVETLTVCLFSIVSALTCQPFRPHSSFPTMWQYPLSPRDGGQLGRVAGRQGGSSWPGKAPALRPLDTLPPWRHLPGVWERGTGYLQRPGGLLRSAHSRPGLWGTVWYERPRLGWGGATGGGAG